MDKIINIKDAITLDDVSIRAERTDKFYQIAMELSNFVRCLPISREENNMLVNLIISQVEEAERGVFTQGFRMGMEYAKENGRE